MSWRRASDHISEPRMATRQPKARRVHPLLAGHLEDAQRIGRDAGEHGGAEIAHQRELEAGAPRPDRDHHGADPLGPVVEAEAAGEEPERGGDLDDVARRHAGRGVAAGHHLAPLGDVRGGVGVQDRVAGGARRRVHAPHAVARRAGEAKGIGVAEVLLAEEGQPRPVGGLRMSPGSAPPSRARWPGLVRARPSVQRSRSVCRASSRSRGSRSASGENMGGPRHREPPARPPARARGRGRRARASWAAR